MTWDELSGKTRDGLRESAARLRALENVVADAGKDNGDLSGDQVGVILILLALAVSNIHSTIECMSIGLDAVVETLRQATETQEVNGE